MATHGTGSELTFKTFRFYPKNEEKKNSAVIVLQEWWGINEQIKTHAQYIADNTGTLAIVPDLYNGKLGLSAEEASHLMGNLNWEEALMGLEKLVEVLNKENRVKIGAIGFCMGGAVSLAIAARLSTKNPLSAAVTCYGIPKPEYADVSKAAIKTPIQGHFGAEDNFCGPDSVRSLERQLKEAQGYEGKEISIHIYEGEGHAFLNEGEWATQKRKELG
ncbi:5182_t:CDS:1, partial [Acaulospora morrowiae]